VSERRSSAGLSLMQSLVQVFGITDKRQLKNVDFHVAYYTLLKMEKQARRGIKVSN
jgi:hypothetical protein